jgi:hypothetical protein
MQQRDLAIDRDDPSGIQGLSCNGIQPKCATKPIAIIDI